MADSMSYQATNHYLPPHAQYYHQTPVNHNHVHVVNTPPPPARTEVTQRKRPKYTRSKTGCLTCRVKKIKCDETKPNCMRCTHGQRDCTWPDGVPQRKKPARKDSVDGRPSTAGSSGISEESTPPTREHTPPRRQPVDINIVAMQSRRPSDNYIHLQPMMSEPDTGRRLSMNNDRAPAYPHHPSNANVLSMIPEASSYPRYQHPYPNGAHAAHTQARQPISTSYRSLSHQPLHQWNAPEPLESYYPSLQERTLVGHGSPTDSHNRYQ